MVNGERRVYMSAAKDNVIEQIQKTDPRAFEIIQKFEKAYKERTGEYFGGFILTEDMTPEEEELALIEYFLRQGCDIITAGEKAKETLREIRVIDAELIKKGRI